MNKMNIDSTSLQKQLRQLLHFINTSRSLIFFVILTSLYGYIVWRINILSNAPPSQTDIDIAQQSVPRPKISDSTIDKLTNLQDNSVRVKALFNEARQNPFQE